MDKNLLQTATQHLNLVPAQPVSKPSGTGEMQLREALEFYPKLKDAPVGDLQAILRRCMLMVGIRATNLPGDEEKAVLLQFAYKWYGNLTIAEIQLAFEKAVAGELEEEANCYENFSCEYFGRIMTAYKEWAKRQWNENQMYIVKPKELTMNQTPDWKPLLELYYQDYLAGRLNFTIMPFEVYGAAIELNYMSGDAWEDWEGTARELTLQQLQADKFECMHEAERYEIQTQIEKILSGEETAQVEKLAKKLSVELLYKTAKQKGIKNLFVQSPIK